MMQTKGISISHGREVGKRAFTRGARRTRLNKITLGVPAEREKEEGDCSNRKRPMRSGAGGRHAFLSLKCRGQWMENSGSLGGGGVGAVRSD